MSDQDRKALENSDGSAEDEEVLEVELDDEPAEEDILEVELDDSPGPRPGDLPPVDAGAIAAASAVEVPAVCAATGRPFVLSVLPVTDGYDVVGARLVAATPSSDTKKNAGPKLQGIFYLTSYEGCPACGAWGLVLCQTCGTVSCAAEDPETGRLLPCPICGNAGPVGFSKKGWSVQATARKAKKGKKKFGP